MAETMFDLEKTIRACMKGDSRAQRVIYDHIGPRMMGLCLRYVANKDDAEEVFHDAMLKVFRHLDKYRGESSLNTWAGRIAVNTALDFLRKEKRQPITVNIADHEHEFAEADEINELSLTAETALQNIRKLNDSYQLLINLHIIEEFSHREIADMLKITEQASRSMLLRAKRALYQITLQSLQHHDTKRANRP
jgi:RNA polymerase sigma factor (sigma-70 family)